MAAARLSATSAAQAGRIFEQLVAATLEAAAPSTITVLVAALVAHLLRANRAARQLAALRVRSEVIVHTGRPAPILLIGPPVAVERARLTAAVSTLVVRAVEAAPPRPAPVAPPRVDRLSPANTAAPDRYARGRAEARAEVEEAFRVSDAARERAEIMARARERRAERAVRAAERRASARERRRQARSARAAERAEARADEAAWREFVAERDAQDRHDAARLARLAMREAAEDRDEARRGAEADSRRERRAAGRVAEAERRTQQRARIERLAAAEPLQAGREAVLETAQRHVEVIEDAEVESSDPPDVIEGWIRVLNGESCERCEAWADGKVRPLGTHMKWHVSCDCTARLVWTTEFDNGDYDITGLDEPVAAKRDRFSEAG